MLRRKKIVSVIVASRCCNDLKDTRDCGRTKGSSFKAAGQTRNRRGPG
jgi:hypothetical protein